MPPAKNRRHTLTLADDGEMLQVAVVILGDRYVMLPIEGDDLFKPVNELVDEILYEARWKLPTAVDF